MTTEFQPPEGFSQDDLFSGEPTRRVKRLRKYAHQRNRKTPFLKLPRRVRVKKAASLRWRIKCDRNGLGVFTSHQYVPGSVDYPLEPGDKGAGWVDFYCMSSQPLRAGLFYNGYARTVLMEVIDKMEKMSKDAAMALLSEAEKEQDAPRAFTSKPDKMGLIEMIFAPSPTFDALGGMTVRGFSGQWLLDHLDDVSNLISIRPHARLLTDYTYGIGLEMLVASPGITVESLAQEIQKFWQRGEVEYEDEPVNLTPYMSEIRASLEATAWSMLRMDARARNLPDPTPAHIRAKSSTQMHTAAVRM